MRSTLPRSAASPRSVGTAPKRPGRRKIVLIVDDDAASRRRIARALAEHAPGADFTMAGTGADARHAIGFHDPDLVVVSAPRERAAGQAALRDLPRAPARPVVVAADDDAVRAAAREIGARDVLARPESAADYAAMARKVREDLDG